MMARNNDTTGLATMRGVLEEGAQLARGIAEVATTIIDTGDDPPLRGDEGTSPAEAVRWAADALTGQIEALRRTLRGRDTTIDGRAETALANLVDGAATVRALAQALRARMADRRHPLVHLAVRAAKAIEADLAEAYDRATGRNTGHPLLRSPPPRAPSEAAAARDDAEGAPPLAAPERLH